MSPLRRLLPYLRLYRGLLFLACLVMAAAAGLNGVMIWALRPAVNAVFSRRDPELLLVVVAVIPAVFALRTALTYAQGSLMGRLGQEITRKIREDLFRHLHGLSMEFFWRSKSGDTLSRLTGDLNSLEWGLHHAPIHLVRDSLTVAFVLGVMFAVHRPFALIALLAVPLGAAVLGALAGRLRVAGRGSQEAMGEISRRVEESLQGMLAVKILNRERSEIDGFEAQSGVFFEQRMRYVRAAALSGPLVELLGGLALAAIVYQGGREILAGRMTPGDFFVFLGGFAAVHGPLKNISQMNADLQLALASAERIFAVLDEKPTVLESPRPVVFESLRRGIEFERVSFRYPGREQWALRAASLSIAPGEIAAVTGLNGAGKSTLAHLLLRLFDPQEGRILLDGRDLRDYHVASLRARMGLVAQETILFNGTLAENVAAGAPDAGADAVARALEAVGAAEFVDRLPLKSRTPLGDRGQLLSGGQRQRIAVARVALKDPPVLILDEAASNLDASGERGAEEALERLYPGRTVLLISHRLSTLRKAGRIFVLHHGEVKESGSHAELLALDGLYAALCKFQFEPAHSRPC